MDVQLELDYDEMAVFLSRAPRSERMLLCRQIIASYNESDISKRRQHDIEQLLGLFAKDAEVSIRQVVAFALKRVELPPRALVSLLAHDKEEKVALPILEHASTLTSDDLMSVMKAPYVTEKHFIAIAKRSHLSSVVSDAIASSGYESAVLCLLHNRNSIIQAHAYERIIDQFSSNQDVLLSLITRPALPSQVINHLTMVVDSDILLRLHYHTQPDTPLGDVVQQHQEKAILSMLYYINNEEHAMRTVQHLHERERLTLPVIITALCIGNLYFFIASLSHLSGMSYHQVHRFVCAKNKEKLQAIYEKTMLPSSLFEALYLTLMTSLEFRLISSDSRGSLRRQLNNVAEKLLHHTEHPRVEHLPVILNVIQHSHALLK